MAAKDNRTLAKQRMAQQQTREAYRPPRSPTPVIYTHPRREPIKVTDIRWRRMSKDDRKKPVESIKAHITHLIERLAADEEAALESLEYLVKGEDALPHHAHIYLGFENWPNRRGRATSQNRLLTDCHKVGAWLAEKEMPWRLEDGLYTPRPGDRRTDQAYVLVLMLRPMGIEDLAGESKWSLNPMENIGSWNKAAVDQFNTVGTQTGRLSSWQPNMMGIPKANKNLRSYPTTPALPKSTTLANALLAKHTSVKPSGVSAGVMKKTSSGIHPATALAAGVRKKNDHLLDAMQYAALMAPPKTPKRKDLPAPSVDTWWNLVKKQTFGAGYGGEGARNPRGYTYGEYRGEGKLHLAAKLDSQPGDYVHLWDENRVKQGRFRVLAVEGYGGTVIRIAPLSASFPHKIVAAIGKTNTPPKADRPKKHKRGGSKSKRRAFSTKTRRKRNPFLKTRSTGMTAGQVLRRKLPGCTLAIDTIRPRGLPMSSRVTSQDDVERMRALNFSHDEIREQMPIGTRLSPMTVWTGLLRM